jgi:hypothetical protein
MDKFYHIVEGAPKATPLNLRTFALRPPLEALCAPPGSIAPVLVPAAK